LNSEAGIGFRPLAIVWTVTGVAMRVLARVEAHALQQ